jgi:hypothetical protein
MKVVLEETLPAGHRKLHREIVHALMEIGIDVHNNISWTANADKWTTAHVIIKIFHKYGVDHPSKIRPLMMLSNKCLTGFYKENEPESFLDINDVYVKLLAVVNYFHENKRSAYGPVEYTANYEGLATKADLEETMENIYNSGSKRQTKPANNVILPPFDMSKTDHLTWSEVAYAKLQAGGISRIVDDKKYAKKHPELNSIVAGLLKAAFINDKSNMQAQFLQTAELANDGCGMWARLQKYYLNPSHLESLHTELTATARNLKYGPPFDSWTTEFIGRVNQIQQIEKKADEANIELEGQKRDHDWVKLYLQKLKADNTTNQEAAIMHNEFSSDPSKYENVFEASCHMRAKLAQNPKFILRGKSQGNGKDDGSNPKGKHHGDEHKSTKGNDKTNTSRPNDVASKGAVVKHLISNIKKLKQEGSDEWKTVQNAIDFLNGKKPNKGKAKNTSTSRKKSPPSTAVQQLKTRKMLPWPLSSQKTPLVTMRKSLTWPKLLRKRRATSPRRARRKTNKPTEPMSGLWMTSLVSTETFLGN